MNAADRLLERLPKARQTGPDRWIAPCPAHEDRSPSLSIRQHGETLLVHDFGGCQIGDVLAAVGLELRDLFEHPVAPHVRSSRSSIPAKEMLVLLDHEIAVAVLILEEVIRLRKIGHPELARLMLASARIGKARDIVNPAQVSHAN